MFLRSFDTKFSGLNGLISTLTRLNQLRMKPHL